MAGTDELDFGQFWSDSATSVDSDVSCSSSTDSDGEGSAWLDLSSSPTGGCVLVDDASEVEPPSRDQTHRNASIDASIEAMDAAAGEPGFTVTMKLAEVRQEPCQPAVLPGRFGTSSSASSDTSSDTSSDSEDAEDLGRRPTHKSAKVKQEPKEERMQPISMEEAEQLLCGPGVAQLPPRPGNIPEAGEHQDTQQHTHTGMGGCL